MQMFCFFKLLAGCFSYDCCGVGLNLLRACRLDEYHNHSGNTRL